MNKLNVGERVNMVNFNSINSLKQIEATATDFNPGMDGLSTLNNGFKSSLCVIESNRIYEWSAAFQSAKSEKLKVCPHEQKKLRYKQKLAADVIAGLMLSPHNPLMVAQAERIRRCNADDNLFVGEDFHNADGEAHNGKGTLWACNSRLCPNCTGKLGKRSRKKIRYVMKNQKLLLGENWYFPTFTMPDLNLKDSPVWFIADVVQSAWKRFTAIETRENKKQTWFQKTVRGGFKNAEFTLNQNDDYHYHLHGLIIAKSSVQRDACLELRQHWTKALQYAFRAHGIKWECDTGNKNFIPALFSFMWSKPLVGLLLNAHHQTKFFGLANVNLVKVDYSNREKVTNELCKYVTKNDSWSKIPIEQLETIVAVPRFWRMFESFGACRETAREMDEKPLETSVNANGQDVNQGDKVNNDTYLDTKGLINRRFLKMMEVRRVSWRIRAKEIPLWQYKVELACEIEMAQSFRRKQLRKKYECAKFQTLAGMEF